MRAFIENILLIYGNRNSRLENNTSFHNSQLQTCCARGGVGDANSKNWFFQIGIAGYKLEMQNWAAKRPGTDIRLFIDMRI